MKADGGERKSEPFFALEEEEHGGGDEGHDAPKDEVGGAVVEFGHVVEVHAVDAGNEGERDEDGGEDGEDFHHVVGFVADVGLEHVDLVGDHGVVDFDGFLGLEDEVVEVAEVGIGAAVDDGGVAVEESGGDFFEGADVFADV